MSVKFSIDDKLIEEACSLGKEEDGKKIMTEALREYIQRRKQVRIVDLFNTIDYNSKYNHKKQRSIQ